MEMLLQNFLNISIMVDALPLLMRGLGMTALLCLAVIPLGLSGGLVVALLARNKNKWFRFCIPNRSQW